MSTPTKLQHKMYKEEIISPSKRRQYTKEQLLALQASPLVSKPASLPPLSQWLNRDPSNRHILNHSSIVSNRFAQPKASVSTPSRSSKYSKVASGQLSLQKDRLQGAIYEDQQQKQPGSSSNSIKNNQPDDETIPEWMNDSPSDLTKDEQTEKMVLDSSHLEAWKLRMKEMDNSNNSNSRNGDDGNSSTHLPADSNEADLLLALESLHLPTTSNNDPTDQKTYTAKTISVHDLFQRHQHLPSPPSLSPLSQQQQQQQQQFNSSSSSTMGTPSYLLSPRDDQIGGFGQILSKQPIISEDNNETFMLNGGFMNVSQHHRDLQRPPPGFMLPSPGHPRPPPMMSTSFSTGTTGIPHDHHHHQYPMHREPQQHMLSPSFSPNNNTNNNMIPSFPLFHHHQYPSSPPPPHPSMLFNNIQQPGVPSQTTPPFLHHHHHHHHQQQQQQQLPFIPLPPSNQHHFMPPPVHTFPSQLLHHPYHQPLVSDLNK